MNPYELDFNTTVRSYDYTKRAVMKMNRLISSKVFDGVSEGIIPEGVQNGISEGSQTGTDQTKNKTSEQLIFEYLMNEMELVSFKDYLKRYIFSRTEMECDFESVSDAEYVRIIDSSFGIYNAPHSFEPTKKRWKKTIQDWVQAEGVKRNTIFLLGFGLGMPAEDVSEFLTKVIREEDFNFQCPEEVVYWYCFRNGYQYSEAIDILEHYQERQSKPSFFKKRVTGEWKEIIQRKDFEKNGRQYLYDYLGDLKKKAGDSPENQAFVEFTRLYEHARRIIVRLYAEEIECCGKRKGVDDVQDVGAFQVEQIISCGIPYETSGNLKKASASLLAKHFHQKRLTRHRIDSIMKKKIKVDRFDLITLLFFIYSQEVEPDWPTERAYQYVDEMNDILRKCDMLEVYPANPYEAFILICLISDDPLSLYSDIWAISYGEGMKTMAG